MCMCRVCVRMHCICVFELDNRPKNLTKQKKRNLKKTNEVTTNLIVNEALMTSLRQKEVRTTHMVIKTMATKVTLIKVMLSVNYRKIVFLCG